MLHLEMLQKRFNDKGKKKTAARVQQDLRSNLGDETKITTMGRKGISTTSSSSLVQSSKLENVIDENKKVNFSI